MYGTYEHNRDIIKHPNCWQTANDHCLPHFHSCLEVVYVLDGTLEAVLNGHPYVVGKNQVLISPSYTVHYYQTPQRCRSIVLTVPLDSIPSLRQSLRQKTFAHLLYQDEGPKSEIYRAMRALAECCGHDDTQEPGVVSKGYIYVVLGLLMERVGMTKIAAGPDASLPREVLAYLQEHCQEPVTLDSLAQTFGYSKSRFSHVFNACFGCGIAEYVNSLRCRNAAMLLENGGASMIDAAMSSGFESMRTFYRSFKKCYGMTPSEYLLDAERNRVRGQKADGKEIRDAGRNFEA